jgi:secondary thiamine-phosphate synthase enzyme
VVLHRHGADTGQPATIHVFLPAHAERAGRRGREVLETEQIDVTTGDRQLVDITSDIARFCSTRGDGLCHVLAPHATAGLALMEVGSSSEGDLAELLERLLPRDDRYGHRHGSLGHGADHLLPVLLSPTLVLAVAAGRLQLGTWQSVVLVDTNADNPNRTIHLSFLPG